MIRLAHMPLPPELHLTKQEAQSQAEAYLAVMAEYDVPISNRLMVWFQLATATIGSYVPKLAELGARKRRERDAKRAAEAGLAPEGAPQQPWATNAPPRGTAAPVAAGGDEIVILTGAPDEPMRFN